MATKILFPQWAMGLQDGIVIQWLKKVGDHVEEGEELVEIETSKVTSAVEATTSGVLLRIEVPEGEVVQVQDVLCLIGTHDEAQLYHAAAAGVTAAEPTLPDADDAPRVEPSEQASGSTPTAIPLVGMRATIARRLVDSLQTMAQVTVTSEADVTELATARAQLKEEVPVTYTDFVIRATAMTLKEHPRLNALVVGEEIQLQPEIHIGVAVALDNGLIVPVVRDADHKSVRDIASESERLAEQARGGTLSPAEVTNSTFSITNLGMYGIDTFTPIVNPPETAILGVGRIVERPMHHNDSLIWRQVMTLSLTFDHRVVDGAPAAAFLQAVIEKLESPASLAD
jgi:pyruvate dehydrogenase E2 component (dihydrolipoamide acetyltransferase)